MITGVTLFSGGGLVEAACPKIRWIGAVEIDAACAAHFRLAHPHTPVLVADVCAVDYKPWRGATVLHTSPSCRNASVANADAGETEEDYQAGCAVARAIREIAPRVFTLENVSGYAKFRAFAHILTTLKELGYRYDWAVYNSADFGTPQTRKRLYVRAWREEYGPLPHVVKTHARGDKRQQGNLFDEPLLPWRGWYGAIEDLIPTFPNAQLADWQMDRLEKLDWFARTFLCRVQGGDSEYAVPTGVPATTISAGHGAAKWRAFVMDSQNSGPLARPQPRKDGDPMFTILAGAHRCMPRAVLVDGQQTAACQGERVARAFTEDDPMFAVPASCHKGMPKALLVHGTSSLERSSSEDPAATVCATVHAKASKPVALLIDGTSQQDRPPTIRTGDEPAIAVNAGEGGRVHRAFLVGDQSARGDLGEGRSVSLRAGDVPAVTVAANPSHKHRAILTQGRVVRLTSRALARFQDVDDGYPLPPTERLACTVIGQGVAGRLQRAMLYPLLCPLGEAS